MTVEIKRISITENIRAIAIHFQKQIIACASDKIQIYDINNGKSIQTLNMKNQSFVREMIFIEDLDQLLYLDVNQSLTLFKVEKKKYVQIIKFKVDSQYMLFNLHFVKYLNKVALLTYTYPFMYFIDLNNQQTDIVDLGSEHKYEWFIVCLQQYNHIAIANIIWDLKLQKCFFKIDINNKIIRAWAKNGKFYSLTENQNIHIKSLYQSKSIRRLQNYNHLIILPQVFSNSAQYFLFQDKDGQLKIYDIFLGKFIYSQNFGRKYIKSYYFISDYDCIIAVNDGQITLMRIINDELSQY